VFRNPAYRGAACFGKTRASVRMRVMRPQRRPGVTTPRYDSTLYHRQQTLRAELPAIADQTNERAAFLRLAETLHALLTRLRCAAETHSVIERQRIVRLLLKEVGR
jgi:hypothetical protein